MSFMDTAQLLGNLGEFVGAVVIVATLIYLAMQVRQNTNALHAQSRQAVLSAAQTEIFINISNPDIPLSQLKTSALSPEEHVKLAQWLSGVMRLREFSWLQYRNGIIDEDQWSTESLVIKNVLSSPINRTWWESLGRRVFSAEFVGFVDDLIRNQPISNDIAELIAGWTIRKADAAV